jgi:spermidine synthase
MKKILSFLFPIKLNSYDTQYNGILDVTLLNGKKILDTAISNYSYGSLQRILHKALKMLPFTETMQDILVLGMGAGSIVQTIRESFQSNARITLVEIDSQIIHIAEKEFQLSKYSGITIIQGDAAAFVKNGSETFDLVIVDLFIIDTIPEIFTQKDFIQHLSKKMRPSARLIYNTIPDTLNQGAFNRMLTCLEEQGVETSIIKKIAGSNNVIIGRKGRFYAGK